MPPTDGITPFFTSRTAVSNTNSTHTSVVPLTGDDGVRYVIIAPPCSGWVSAIKSGGLEVSLCEYTKVKLLNRKDGRVYFQLLDGNLGHIGSEFSMKEVGAIEFLHKSQCKSGIFIDVLNLKTVQRIYSVQRAETLDQCLATLSVGNMNAEVTLCTKGDRESMFRWSIIPDGTYKIMAPDAPHGHTERYRPNQDKSYYDTVWFPIEYENKTRYLHIGHFSEGCVTVTNIIKWREIYKTLISHRSDGNQSNNTGGGQYIGTINIKSSAGAKSVNSTTVRVSAF